MSARRLPTDAEIAARAQEMNLLGPGGSLAPGDRSRVAAILFREAQTPPAAPEVQLRSRQEHPVDGGILRIDVVFIPNQKVTPPNG